MRKKAIYINRSDMGWYSKNANVYRKALEMVSKYEAVLCLGVDCRVPKEIEEKAVKIVRFHKVRDLLAEQYPELAINRTTLLFTGFDFPCMRVAKKLKTWHGCFWTVFCWDPPNLSHRDRFPPLRWAIDWVFRHYVKHCDKLVLNIHPGLLEEIGYQPREGQLELRLQDAFEGMKPAPIQEQARYDYDFGVLSNWCAAKGSELVVAAMKKLPGKKCLWIGDSPEGDGAQSKKREANRVGITFAGRLAQDEAFAKLRTCRVLLAPYLPVRSLKWNYVLKLFEYLQLGRTIVASDNPGTVTVAERYAGRITLFKSGDVDDLVRALKAGDGHEGVAR